MKRNLLILCMLCVLACIHAQGPNNSGTYYQNADGQKGAALKTALCNIINNHTQLTYKEIWTAVETVDLRDDGKILDRYSNATHFTPVADRAGNYKAEGDVYNREHSFPKSWFNDGYPMYTDLTHLMATDGYVNNRRSNHPFGETAGEQYMSANGYSKLGACTYEGYTGTVFEPDDEWKGDFARIYFYMVTCYEDKVSSWKCEMLSSNAYPALSSWALNMLLDWAKGDPVSEVEKARNEGIYGIQGNRNPFVDYPELEQYIWGAMKEVPFSYDNYVPTEIQTIEYQTRPVEDTWYNLKGQKVEQPGKGVYIKNGKKYILK